MIETASISKLPTIPAVYAMYGGKGGNAYVAYVGIARNLKQRIVQHLVRRDRSVATGASATVLNVDLVTQVRWWKDDSFTTQDVLQAAELVAFEVLQPSLRSRGRVTDPAYEIHKSRQFTRKMQKLFTGDPTGRLKIVTLEDALARIADLEDRVKALEGKLRRNG